MWYYKELVNNKDATFHSRDYDMSTWYSINEFTLCYQKKHVVAVCVGVQGIVICDMAVETSSGMMEEGSRICPIRLT